MLQPLECAFIFGCLVEFESKLVLNGYGNCLKNIGASKSCHVGLLRGALVIKMFFTGLDLQICCVSCFF
jgi:hypothetical protein